MCVIKSSLYFKTKELSSGAVSNRLIYRSIELKRSINIISMCFLFVLKMFLTIKVLSSCPPKCYTKHLQLYFYYLSLNDFERKKPAHLQISFKSIHPICVFVILQIVFVSIHLPPRRFFFACPWSPSYCIIS